MTIAPNQTGMIKKSANMPAKRPPKDIKGWLKQYEGEIARALPAQIGKDRFNRICTTMLTSTPALKNCTPESFIGAVLNVAQLGLEPNTPLGQAYLIPYKGKATLQIGYRGMIRLARNSKEIAMIKAQTVYENDEFSYQLGLNPDIKHIPAKGDRGKAVAYYAFYKTKDGDFDFEVATKLEMEAHGRKYSQSYNRGPWSTNFDEMAKKTLVKRVLKYAPMDTEVARNIEQDESVKNFNPKEPEIELQLVQSEYIEADYEESELENFTDPETGEIKEEPAKA